MIIDGGDVFRIEHERQPNARTIWMPKRFRHNANDGVKSPINQQRASEHIWSRIKCITPEIVANNCNRRAGVAPFFRRKAATLCGRQTKNRKEIRGDLRRWHCLRRSTIVYSHASDAACASGDVFKSVAAVFAELLHRAS